jgi:YgiT-type zinc finger domain-containing protein
MICVICKTGTTHAGKTNTLFERDGSFVIVKEIPAMVCSQCGEAYFDEKTTEELYHKTSEILNSGAELEVIKMKAA